MPGNNIQELKLKAILNEIETRNSVDPPPLPHEGDLTLVGAATVSVDLNAADDLLGHSFSFSAEDIASVSNAINAGTLAPITDFAQTTGNARFAGISDPRQDKLVFSGSADDFHDWAVSTVSNNFLQHITSFPVDGTRIDTIFNPNGGTI